MLQEEESKLALGLLWWEVGIRVRRGTQSPMGGETKNPIYLHMHQTWHTLHLLSVDVGKCY